MTDQLYPVAVFSARYGGTYEGAPWIAVNTHVDPQMAGEILAGSQGDDVECFEWFQAPHRIIGRGDTPDAAVSDLARKLDIAWKPGDDNMMSRFQRAIDEAEAEKNHQK